MLPVGPDTAQAIVDACCTLHNYLLKKTSSYCPPGFADSFDEEGNVVEGKWRQVVANMETALTPVPKQTQGRPSTSCVNMRNHLMSYVCSPVGVLKWQHKYA